MTTPRERLAALPPLSKGAHKHEDEGACVMEAVAYVAGEPWTDRPACACPVLGTFCRSWNDALPTDADRDRLLRPLIPRLAGSRATPEVETCRAWLAVDWLVRTCAPTWLALTKDLEGHAHALRGLPALVSADVAREHHSTITAARAAAGDATRAAAGAAAGDAAWDAAWAAARAAAGAAAGDATRAAAGDAAWDAAAAAAGDAARAALQPTVATLQRSALDLVDRMLAETASE